MTGLLNHALQLAEFGLSVFPLQPGDKRPLGRLLPLDENNKPTWKPFQIKAASIEQVREWWTLAPDANIGMACGSVSGLYGLDIDGPEGVATLQTHDKLPATPVSKTGDGYHTFFKHPGFTVH